MNLVSRALALLLIISSAAIAQEQAAPTQDVERETRRPAAARDAAETAAAASQASTEGVVTYEQVLERPDDVELNYRYAKGQIASGDLKGAAATLERVLMVKPELHKVRLVYAIVLYRLGNLSESERELAKLEEPAVPEPVRAEAATWRKAVAKGRKKNHLSGRLAAGFEYDTNRNASPTSGRKLFNDIQLNASGAAAKRDDTSALWMAGVEYRRDLRRATELFLNANYFRSEQTLLDALDLQAYSAEGGAVLRPWAKWEFTPKLSFDHVLLSQSTFLRNRGVAFRAEKRQTQKTSYFFEGRDVYNDFVRTRGVPSAPDRTGHQIDLTGGFGHILSPKMRVTAAYTHTVKQAREEFWQFSRDGLELTHTWLLGRGAFMVSGFEARRDRYKRPEVSISRKLRRDTTVRASLLLGAPLPFCKSVVATLAYDYYQAFSTITNYAYTNNKIAALATYRWDLGF